MFKILITESKEYTGPIASFVMQLFTKCEANEAIKYDEVDLEESTLDLQIGAALPVPFSVKLLRLLHEILQNYN